MPCARKSTGRDRTVECRRCGLPHEWPVRKGARSGPRRWAHSCRRASGCSASRGARTRASASSDHGITRASYPESAPPRERSRHGPRPRGWSCPIGEALVARNSADIVTPSHQYRSSGRCTQHVRYRREGAALVSWLRWRRCGSQRRVRQGCVGRLGWRPALAGRSALRADGLATAFLHPLGEHELEALNEREDQRRTTSPAEPCPAAAEQRGDSARRHDREHD